MCSNNTYKKIYERTSRLKCSDEQLKAVKSRFSCVINSSRRLDYIKSLEQLLRILEKRDYLNASNIGPLIEIGNIVGCVLDESILEDVNIRQISRDPKQRAYHTIANDIGHKWRDLARALEIPEGKIEELHNYHRISDRVYEILQIHEETCDRRTWLSSLLKALRRTRRSDLSNKVQHIFDTS